MDRVGLVKTTLVDYPGKVAAAIFLPGCNLRCPYCHNPRLVDGSPPNDLSTYQEAMEFLRKRRRVLGGVCVSGGEPSLHTNLQELVKEIQAMGLPVKIDTNGSRPDILREIGPDFIAMDIKTSLGRYAELTDDPELKITLPDRVRESVEYVLSSGIGHEFRTTVAPGIAGYREIEEISDLIAGADHYVLAEFRPGATLDPTYNGSPAFERKDFEAMQDLVRKKGIPVSIRFRE